MGSRPPPLPSASVLSVQWISLVSDGSNPSSWINWRAILASASLSFALVVSIVAWIITHPSKRAGATESLPFASLATGVQSPPRHTIERIVELPAPPLVPFIENSLIETSQAVHQRNRPDRGDDRILVLEDTHLPLSPPVPPQPRCNPTSADQPASPQPVGETYGTQVLFLNKQEAASELAKRDHKLLFVMHISGNFEDSCFT
jgi:hypothetical protein